MTTPIARKIEQLQAMSHLVELMMVAATMAIDDPSTIDAEHPQATACRDWLEGFGSDVHDVKDLPKEVRQLLLDELAHEFGL